PLGMVPKAGLLRRLPRNRSRKQSISRPILAACAHVRRAFLRADVCLLCPRPGRRGRFPPRLDPENTVDHLESSPGYVQGGPGLPEEQATPRAAGHELVADRNCEGLG